MDEPEDSPRPSKRALRREAFFRQHPRCCFCNGENATDEIDHAPARACFRGKEGPEDFEFPACSRCNRAAAFSEQVMALYIRFTDNNPENFRDEDFTKLFWGVANNSPQAVPMLDAETSRRLQGEGDVWSGKPGSLIIPKAAHRHMELFATKVLYAMYYRVAGHFAGPRHRRLVTWAQAGTPAAVELDAHTEAWFGDLNVGSRRNIDLGDQFHFRHGYNAAHGFLGLSMSFGQALFFFCVLGPSSKMAELKPRPPRYQPIWQLGLSVQRRAA